MREAEQGSSARQSRDRTAPARQSSTPTKRNAPPPGGGMGLLVHSVGEPAPRGTGEIRSPVAILTLDGRASSGKKKPQLGSRARVVGACRYLILCRMSCVFRP